MFLPESTPNTPTPEPSTNTPSEARIQAECFAWFHNTFPHLRGLLFHVPNGEKRDAATARKLKAMGVVRGIPDFIFLYRFTPYGIEMKGKGGEQSKEQKEIEAVWKDHAFYYLADSLKDFQHIINTIINEKR